jgi:transcriptional regulator with XRE-family HTH domain
VQEIPDRWRELGKFIREQRDLSRLSLRRLSDLAGISNPYLSQIERGLRKPSAEILQQIAKALAISAETLYERAGLLDPRAEHADTIAAIQADPLLTEDARQTLIKVYRSLRTERSEAELVVPAPEDPGAGGAVGGAAGAGAGAAG